MAIPVMAFIDGQGGNISINGIVLQPTMYRIVTQFGNVNTTTTGSGGWRQFKRVISGWGFQAHLLFDAAHLIDGVTLTNGIYVPIGINAPIEVPCVFQIGSAPLIYQGLCLIETNSPGLQAEGVVDLEISGQGTGPRLGPIAGSVG